MKSTSDDQRTRVLVVEDEDVDAMLIQRLLCNPMRGEFSVDRAKSLHEATSMLQASRYDVALLDLELPDGQDIDSLHRLRAIDATLPIVILTGHDDELMGLQAVEAGAQDFVCKSVISGRVLYRVLTYAIARQSKMLGITAEAHTDPLTGLPNRRHLDKKFDELSACESKLCVAMFDIDHFKSINDRFGHSFGDFVLQGVARALSQELGESGLVARFGGEEFAVLMAGCEEPLAITKIQSALRKVESMQFENGAVQTQVTVSAGVAQVQPSDDWQSVSKRADAALYLAKDTGRNQVIGSCRSTLV